MIKSLKVLSAIVLAALAGCASLDDAEPPEVGLADLRMLDSGLFEQRLEVTLRLANPNDFDLDLDGLSFVLDVNGSRLVSGRTGESFTVPRLGEARVPVQASTTLLELAQQMLLMADRSQLDYRLSGIAYIDSFRRRSVPFEKTGSLKLLSSLSGLGTFAPQ